MSISLVEAARAYGNACLEADGPQPTAHIGRLMHKIADELDMLKAYQSSYEELTDEFAKLDAGITELSKTWIQHPKMPDGELWDGPCMCHECCGYEGENYSEE